MSQNIFRTHAAAARLAAANTNLANRRAMHERSAAVWDDMAIAAEDTAQRAQVNQLAKGK